MDTEAELKVVPRLLKVDRKTTILALRELLNNMRAAQANRECSPKPSNTCNPATTKVPSTNKLHCRPINKSTKAVEEQEVLLPDPSGQQPLSKLSRGCSLEVIFPIHGACVDG